MHAQNQLPVVTINQVNVDTASKTISINFDATDPDNDTLLISVFLSADSGRSFLAPLQAVQGDVGNLIPSGLNKSVQLSYNTDSLMVAAGGDPNSWFRIRIVASDRKPYDLSSLLAEIDSSLVIDYMQTFSGSRNHIANQSALDVIRDSIATKLQRFGLQTQRSDFAFGTYGGQNIWGRKPGLIDEEHTILVDAHYDAVSNTPGADDNASGLAGTLISAEILSVLNFEKTLKFIAFDKEESGLLGAGYYVSNSIPSYEDIEVVLNMEMIGYYDDAPNTQLIPSGFSQLFPAAVDSINASGNRGIWLFVVGNQNSSSYSIRYDSIARLYIPDVNTLVLNVPGNGQIAPALRRSDHAKFWDAGYKALMLTDGADYRNLNYHTPGDSLGTLNIAFLIRNIQATLISAAALAKPISATTASAGSWQLLTGLTSVENPLRPDSWELFPVPALDQVYLRTNLPADQYRFRILDAAGKLVQELSLTLSGLNQLSRIELNHLEHGLYYTELVSSKCRLVKKMVLSESHVH